MPIVIVAGVGCSIPFSEVCTYEDAVASDHFMLKRKRDLNDQLQMLANERDHAQHRLDGPMEKVRARIEEAQKHIDELCCHMKKSENVCKKQVAMYGDRMHELEAKLENINKPLQAMPLGRLFLRASTFCSHCPPYHGMGVYPADIMCQFEDAIAPICDVDFKELHCLLDKVFAAMKARYGHITELVLDPPECNVVEYVQHLDCTLHSKALHDHLLNLSRKLHGHYEACLLRVQNVIELIYRQERDDMMDIKKLLACGNVCKLAAEVARVHKIVTGGSTCTTEIAHLRDMLCHTDETCKHTGMSRWQSQLHDAKCELRMLCHTVKMQTCIIDEHICIVKKKLHDLECHHDHCPGEYSSAHYTDLFPAFTLDFAFPAGRDATVTLNIAQPGVMENYFVSVFPDRTEILVKLQAYMSVVAEKQHAWSQVAAGISNAVATANVMTLVANLTQEERRMLFAIISSHTQSANENDDLTKFVTRSVADDMVCKFAAIVHAITLRVAQFTREQEEGILHDALNIIDITWNDFSFRDEGIYTVCVHNTHSTQNFRMSLRVLEGTSKEANTKVDWVHKILEETVHVCSQSWAPMDVALTKTKKRFSPIAATPMERYRQLKAAPNAENNAKADQMLTRMNAIGASIDKQSWETYYSVNGVADCPHPIEPDSCCPPHTHILHEHFHNHKHDHLYHPHHDSHHDNDCCPPEPACHPDMVGKRLDDMARGRMLYRTLCEKYPYFALVFLSTCNFRQLECWMEYSESSNRFSVTSISKVPQMVLDLNSTLRSTLLGVKKSKLADWIDTLRRDGPVYVHVWNNIVREKWDKLCKAIVKSDAYVDQIICPSEVIRSSEDIRLQTAKIDKTLRDALDEFNAALNNAARFRCPHPTVADLTSLADNIKHALENDTTSTKKLFKLVHRAHVMIVHMFADKDHTPWSFSCDAVAWFNMAWVLRTDDEITPILAKLHPAFRKHLRAYLEWTSFYLQYLKGFDHATCILDVALAEERSRGVFKPEIGQIANSMNALLETAMKGQQTTTTYASIVNANQNPLNELRDALPGAIKRYPFYTNTIAPFSDQMDVFCTDNSERFRSDPITKWLAIVNAMMRDPLFAGHVKWLTDVLNLITTIKNQLLPTLSTDCISRSYQDLVNEVLLDARFMDLPSDVRPLMMDIVCMLRRIAQLDYPREYSAYVEMVGHMDLLYCQVAKEASAMLHDLLDDMLSGKMCLICYKMHWSEQQHNIILGFAAKIYNWLHGFATKGDPKKKMLDMLEEEYRRHKRVDELAELLLAKAKQVFCLDDEHVVLAKEAIPHVKKIASLAERVAKSIWPKDGHTHEQTARFGSVWDFFHQHSVAVLEQDPPEACATDFVFALQEPTLARIACEDLRKQRKWAVTKEENSISEYLYLVLEHANAIRIEVIHPLLYPACKSDENNDTNVHSQIDSVYEKFTNEKFDDNSLLNGLTNLYESFYGNLTAIEADVVEREIAREVIAVKPTMLIPRWVGAHVMKLTNKPDVRRALKLYDYVDVLAGDGPPQIGIGDVRQNSEEFAVRGALREQLRNVPNNEAFPLNDSQVAHYYTAVMLNILPTETNNGGPLDRVPIDQATWLGMLALRRHYDAHVNAYMLFGEQRPMSGYVPAGDMSTAVLEGTFANTYLEAIAGTMYVMSWKHPDALQKAMADQSTLGTWMHDGNADYGHYVTDSQEKVTNLRKVVTNLLNDFGKPILGWTSDQFRSTWKQTRRPFLILATLQWLEGSHSSATNTYIGILQQFQILDAAYGNTIFDIPNIAVQTHDPGENDVKRFYYLVYLLQLTCGSLDRNVIGLDEFFAQFNTA